MAWTTQPTVVVQLTGSDATVGPAASATVKRRIRQVRAVNTTAGAVTFSMGIAATFAAATAMFNAKSVPANDAVNEFFSPGQQWTNQVIRALAGAATSITLHITYEEEPIVA